MRMINGNLLYGAISLMCLIVVFVACGGDEKCCLNSLIKGDSIVIKEYKQYSVDEAMENVFGNEKSQDSLSIELRRAIKEKYKRMGDSLQRKLLRGEKIH